MSMTPYAKLLKMGKEKVQEVLAVPRSMEMKHKAQHEISKLDVRIAEQDNKIQEIGSEYPIDFDKLIKAQDELALAQRRKKQLQKIVAEMFP
jgi:hypothetical protein